MRALLAAVIVAAAILSTTVRAQQPTTQVPCTYAAGTLTCDLRGILETPSSTPTNTPTAPAASPTTTNTPTTTRSPSPSATATPSATAVPTSSFTATSTPSSVIALIVADNTLQNDGCVKNTAGFDWATGPAHRTWSPKGTHLAAWAMVEWDCQHDVGPMVQIEVRDFRLYGLVFGRWQLITQGIYGSQVNDSCFCTGTIYASAGSGPYFTSPPHDRGIQFYQAFVPIPSGLTAVYATYRARLTAPSDAYLMLNVGADWASFPFHDYGDMGVSRLKRLTTGWQQYAMTTLSESALRANPPP